MKKVGRNFFEFLVTSIALYRKKYVVVEYCLKSYLISGIGIEISCENFMITNTMFSKAIGTPG